MPNPGTAGHAPTVPARFFGQPARLANPRSLSILATMGRPSSENVVELGAEGDEPIRRLLAAGDRRAALAALMELHGDTVYRYCASLLRDPHQAEDVLQTVFLDAFQALPAFEGRSTFRTWLLGIARHRCLDGVRKRSRWRRLFGLGGGAPEGARPGRDAAAVDAAVARVPQPGPGADAYADAEIGPLLEECLGGLAPAARDSVILRFRSELSFQEMATVAGATPGALRVRVCRAVEALRRCLETKGVMAA